MNERRHFLSRFLGWGGAAAAAAAVSPVQAAAPAPNLNLPGGLSQLFLARPGRRGRSSSWDRSGKNADAIPAEPGQKVVIADIQGAGSIRHIWITVADNEPDFLRRLVLRAWWDGEREPSIETPLGDFFGVGHARASNYWSMPLNMVTGGSSQSRARVAMNCFFPMPFARGARLEVENQGKERARSVYFYVDYESYDALPAEALRFHAHWRRQNPTPSSITVGQTPTGQALSMPNLDGKLNYVIMEATGRGHYVGCNISIDNINALPKFNWFGEGDDMIFIDGDTTPTLTGTGTEDYFCAAWGYPGGFNAMPYHGISLAGPTEGPAEWSGKWTMYRYHVEDPVMFQKSIKVTIEHGHANALANDYSSVGYWYQTEPHAAFPPLLPVDQRLPIGDQDSLRGFWKNL